MNYINVNLNILEKDIMSERVSFEVGMAKVPKEEKERFLLRLNRLLSEERSKFPAAGHLRQLEKLDELVTSAITAIRTERANRLAAKPTSPFKGGLFGRN